jgi:hypothetical protein
MMENDNFLSQFYGGKMARSKSREMAKRMAGYFNVTAPPMHWARMGKDSYTGWQDSKGLTVNIDKGNWTPILLAHETAHWVCYKRKWNDSEGHGPEWLRVYIEILDRAKIMPKVAMMAVCRKYKLKIKRGEL